MTNVINLYSVRDDKVGEFQAPVVLPNHSTATRSFGDMIAHAKPDSIYALHPDDFSIHYIGSFNVDTGVLSPDPVTCIARGSDFVK